MNDEIVPFELCEIQGKKILSFYGKQYDRGIIQEDKLPIILDAIIKGWDVHICYAIIRGNLIIHDIAYGLGLDDDGNRVIKGDISIENSEICGDVYLCAHLLDYVDVDKDNLVGVMFNGNLDFRYVAFGGTVDFSGAFITRRADFGGAIFSSGANFEGAIFDETADFGGATFGGDANFGRTTFSDEAYFHEVSFLRAANLNRAELSRLSPYCFEGIGWAYRKSSLFGAGYFFEQAGEGYWEKRYPNASESFRNAKVEYEKEGKYDDAGRMYVREKESARLQLKIEQTNLPKRVWLWIWKYTSNYGESPLRFIGWVAAIVFLFAFVYLPIMSKLFSLWPSIAFEEYPFRQWSDGIIDGVAYNTVTALYFSAVTFATLGFGDIAPVNILGKVCAIAEVLLGYLMFGVLITLVARKMTRS